MKIRAIRGCNLASLTGEFEVDFTQGALKDAGLFAITGPTGAGKSTLLDALCLALFNNTPRLKTSSRTTRIGSAEENEDARITAQDSRSLLQRGAVEGFAEVVFSAADGKNYRARWSVWRARKKADGALQPAGMELWDAGDGSALHCSAKEQTLAKIESLIGLSFDQFCRSVLLAQNDFAAFLKAGAGERAALLETMTGTEIYGAISKAAHGKASGLKSELEALQQGLPVSALTGETRATLQQESREIDLREAELNAAQKAYEKGLEWHTRLDALANETAQGKQALKLTVEAQLKTAPQRELLKAVEAAQPHRPVFEKADSSADIVEKMTQAFSLRQREEQDALQQLKAAQAQCATVATERDTHVELEKTLAPQIEAALTLDSGINNAGKEAVDAGKLLSAAKNSAQQASDQAAKINADIHALETVKQSAKDWLARHSASEKLAGEWLLRKPQLESCAALRSTIEALQKKRQTLEKEAARLDAQLQKLKDEENTKAADLRKTEAHAATAQKQAAENPAQAARDARADAEANMRTLDTLHGVWSSAKQLGEQVDKEFQQAASFDHEAEEEHAKSETHKKMTDETAARLATAEGILAQVTSALDFTERRAELREGCECPLCGSKEHPWAAQGAPDNAALKAVKKSVADLRKVFSAHEKTHTAALASAKAATDNASRARERAAQFRAQIEAANVNWARYAASLKNAGLPASVSAPTATMVAEKLESARQSVEEKLAKEQTAQKLEAAHTTAIQQLNELRKQLSAAAEQRQALSLDCHAKLQDVSQCESALNADTRKLEETLSLLQPAFSERDHWRESLRKDPRDFLESCELEVTEWNKRVNAAEKIERMISDLQPPLEAAKASADLCVKTLKERFADYAKREARLKELAAERAKLLSGRETNSFKTALQNAGAALDTRLSEAKAALAAAGQTSAIAAERRETAERQLREASAQRDTAEAALALVLTTLGLTHEALRQQLAHDTAWIQTQRAELDVLEKTRVVAQSTLTERQRAKIEHEKTGHPQKSRSDLNQQLAAIKEDLAAVKLRRDEVKARLGQDEMIRQQLADRLAVIGQKQQALGLWEGISDLIGSSDGKKFRAFAQSLTLDDLMLRANAHLAELAPRYSLERVPGTDMDLQIRDHDMGDERRGTGSLSGGESFLVSLALALALSSLAANRTRVETLFIDEGFGALDPDTLETAIEVLDSLQSDGRKVGIISHVPGLAERIGVKIRVVQQGGGRSRVLTAGG
jgi:exonuclease SbcC